MSTPLASEDEVENAESTGLLTETEAAFSNNNEDSQRLELGPSNSNDAVDRAQQEWLEKLNRWQSNACLMSHSFSLLGAILVIWWIHLLGGLAWEDGKSKQVFNWHPLLMVLAFCFMTVAALSFRSPYRPSTRSTVKFVHGCAWAVASIFAIIALIAVFKSHNDKASGFIANLYSFHSWCGMFVIGMYVLQFLAGFFAFGWTLTFVTPLMKKQILSIHSFLGPFIYVAVAATIFLGIQEKEGFVKCAYNVEKADLFPLSHIKLIPAPCLVSHVLGIVILATTLSTCFALHDF